MGMKKRNRWILGALLALLLCGVLLVCLWVKPETAAPTAPGATTAQTTTASQTQTPAVTTQVTQTATHPVTTVLPTTTVPAATTVPAVTTAPPVTTVPPATVPPATVPPTTATPPVTTVPPATTQPSVTTQPSQTAPTTPPAPVDPENVITDETLILPLLREGLKARESNIVIRVNVPKTRDERADEWWGRVAGTLLDHTGVPTEGDYLKEHIDRLRWGAFEVKEVNGRWVGYTEYSAVYLTTAEQEKELDAEVKRILDALDLYEESDANKVFGIYKYICDNVKYGNAFDQSLNNAYDALVNKVTICGGYALAFYRLALELGVDARYISGTAYLGGHAWNIVGLDGLYYNLDTTWDAGHFLFEYYLKSPANFTSHKRFREYDTAEFHQMYPMGQTNYCGGSGKIGDSIYWKATSDGTVVISGKGEMPDLAMFTLFEDVALAPWYYAAEGIRRVVIQDGITRIGAKCFSDCPSLVSVEMADSVVCVGTSAFSSAHALENLRLSKNLREIGNYAFSGAAITRLDLPQTLRTIGYGAFSGCPLLAEVTLPEGLQCIGNSAFGECVSLTRIRIPDSVDELGARLFSDCTGLREVIIGNPTILGEAIFYNCTALETVNSPSGETAYLNHVTKEMFYGCSALRRICVITASVGERGFQNCTSLESIRFTYSGECSKDAFKNCTALKTVYIPRKNQYAWMNFSNAESNPLHNGAMLYDEEGLVTHVDYSVGMANYNQYTFYGCQSLTSVHIQCEKLGAYVFANCTNLKYVTTSNNDNSLYSYSSGCRSIDEGAFMNCTSLEWVALGDNCYTIRDSAFQSCGKLSTIYLNADESRWDTICQGAPALKNIAVVLNTTAPLDRIDHQCPDCKQALAEKEEAEDVFMPESGFWG